MTSSTKTRYIVTGSKPGYRYDGPESEKEFDVSAVTGDVFLVDAGEEPDDDGDLAGEIERTGMIESLSVEDLTLESTVLAKAILAQAEEDTAAVGFAVGDEVEVVVPGSGVYLGQRFTVEQIAPRPDGEDDGYRLVDLTGKFSGVYAYRFRKVAPVVEAEVVEEPTAPETVAAVVGAIVALGADLPTVNRILAVARAIEAAS